MSYTYKKMHTTVNYTKGNDGRKYIVIHYTGNKTDTAKANANYFKNVNRGASAHLFVDDSYVYEVVGLNDTAWAVGKNYGTDDLFGICTNKNSISIEMCSVNGKISDKTFQNTVCLTIKLMKKYNIPVSHVVRHYDVCKKQCPGWKGWIGSDQSIWKKFKNSIADNSDSVKIKARCRLYKSTVVVKGSFASLPVGKYVTFVKDTGKGWSKVKATISGKTITGYVKNTCIKKSGLSQYRTAVVTATVAVIRKKNTKKSKILARVPKNADVKVVSVGKLWVNVIYTISNKKVTGFIYRKRIKCN